MWIRLTALLSALGGVYLIGIARTAQTPLKTGVSGGVLLLVMALGAAGVLLGGRRYGPSSEGPLELSARLGLGFLGGALGALGTALVQWLLETFRVSISFGVAAHSLGWSELPMHALQGALWGTLFGVLLPLVPGRTIPARGAAFSLLPSLYVLLKVFPVDLDVGYFGSELGTLAFVFVLLYNLIWGLVAASLLAWGERTSLAPVTRALGEPPTGE